MQNALEFISSHRQGQGPVIEKWLYQPVAGSHRTRCARLSHSRGSPPEHAFSHDMYPLRRSGSLPLAPGVRGDAIVRQENDQKTGFPTNPFVVCYRIQCTSLTRLSHGDPRQSMRVRQCSGSSPGARSSPAASWGPRGRERKTTGRSEDPNRWPVQGKSGLSASDNCLWMKAGPVEF